MGISLSGILQFVLATFLVAIAANLLALVAGQIYAAMIRSKAREPEIRDDLVRYARIATGLGQRVEARKADAVGAAADLFGVQRQEKQLRSRLRELELSPHRFVRLIGSEQLPNRPFEVLVFNSSVAHQAKRGEKHPFYDASWGAPCPVHVWARGPDEAKHELERVFPAAGGFKTVHFNALPADDRTVESAVSEAAQTDPDAVDAAKDAVPA